MKSRIKYYFTLKDFRGNKETWSEVLGKSNESINLEETNILLREYLIPRYDEGIVEMGHSETPNYEGLKNRIYAWLNSTVPYYTKLISLYRNEEDNLMSKLVSLSERDLSNIRSGGNTNTLTNGPQKSTSRENDTPQNGGMWIDDEHTSNISTNETESYTNTYNLVYNNQKIADTGTITTSIDPDTVINRLEDIRRKYINFYEKWCEDFERFVYFPAEFENQNEAGYIYYTEE